MAICAWNGNDFPRARRFLNRFLDNQARWLGWALRRAASLARGRPGQAEREASRRAYDESEFALAAERLLAAVDKAPADDLLRLDAAQWGKFGLVDHARTRALLESVVEAGPPHLARRAAVQLVNFVWEHRGAGEAAALVRRHARWLDRRPPSGLRLAALLNDAGARDEALDLLREIASRDIEAHDRMGYLELACLADGAGIGRPVHGPAARRIAERLDAGARRLEESLGTGAGVAVVANGPSLRGMGLGRAIDGHGRVIRFNNHNGDVDPADQGSRTDIWFRPAGDDYVPWREPPLPGLIVFTGANFRHRFSNAVPLIEACPVGAAGIATVPASLYLDLFARLGASPSAGMIGLALLARQCGGQVPVSQVFGYSLGENTESMSYYHQATVRGDRPSRHNWAAEETLFRALIAGAPTATGEG